MRLRIAIVVIACMLTAIAWQVGRRALRAWSVPDYHVAFPTEFNVVEAIGGGKGSEQFHYSPRQMYLDYHRIGWNHGKEQWLYDSKNSTLAQVPAAGNQGLRDGREQFLREVSW